MSADSGKRGRHRVVAFVVGVALPVMILAGCERGGAPGESLESGSTVEKHPIAGNFEPDGTTLDDCRATGGQERCLEQAYGNLAFRLGGRNAMRRVAEDMAADTAVERDCHRIVHTVGSATLARNDGDVGKTFTEGDSTCWSGYYHGILERALVGATNDVLLAATVRGICADVLREEARFTAYQCVHGLGHGLMIRTGLDLPGSLEMCDRLDTEWEQTSCHGGVFMENFNTSYGVVSRYLEDDDLLYPCTAVEVRHKLYCYLQVTDRVLAATSYDWRRAAELCAGAEAAWRATCFQSFGRNASGVARLDRLELVRLCGMAPGHWQVECVYGAARDITANDAGGERAMRFCAAVEDDMRARCYYGIGTILRDIAGAGELAAACAGAPAAYAPECRLERAAD